MRVTPWNKDVEFLRNPPLKLSGWELSSFDTRKWQPSGYFPRKLGLK